MPHFTRIVLSWVLFCALFTPTLLAQQAGKVDPTFGASLGLAGNVRATLLQPDGKLIVTGFFKQKIVRLNTDGSADTSFHPGTIAGDFIYAAALQPDGKIVVSSYSASFDGSTSNAAVARLNADGSLDAGFNPGASARGFAGTLALQSDGKIIIAGDAIARLNLDGTTDTGFDPGTGASNSIDTLAVQPNGKILIGGTFTAFDGVARNAIARLKANGALDTDFDPGTGANAPVATLALQPDGKVVLGGFFTSVNGATHNYIARLNSDGSLDPDFGPGAGADNAIDALALQGDGKIVVGGGFSNFDGVPRHSLARLNADGSLDTGFDPGAGASDRVDAVTVQADGKIVAGGAFTSFNGTARNSLVRVNADGGTDSAFRADDAAGPNALVAVSAVRADGKILIGGSFTSFSGVTRNNLALLNADGSLDTDFDPGLGANGFVDALAVQPDGKVIAAGDSLARFNADGSVDSTFQVGTGADSSIYAASVQPDGKIVIGGVFAHFDGVARNTLARLNADGSLDTGFDPSAGANGPVDALAVQADGKILVGGGFTSFSNTARANLARLNADGSLDTGFTPGTLANGLFGFIDTVVARPDGKILAGGSFTAFDGVGPRAATIARFNADGSLDPVFDPGSGASDHIDTIAVQADGSLVVGGFFVSFNGVARNSLAKLGPDGALDTGFDPGTGTNAPVRTLTVQAGGKIVVGGEFTLVGGVVSNYLARLDASGVPDPTFVPGIGDATVNALVLQSDDGKVLIGGNFFNVGGVPINSLARLNGSDGSLDPSFAPDLALGNTVQAIAVQPDDGNVLVAVTAMVDAASNLSGLTATRAGPGQPQTQTRVQNKIHRASKANGKFDPSFNAATDGTTLQVVGLPGGQALIGGTFAQVNGAARANLARLNTDGSLDVSFVGVADGSVRALVVQKANGAIYVGGDFANVDGVARSRVARLNADGTLDAGFAPGAGPNGAVNALKALANGQVLIGGSFTSVGGVARGGLARLNADGSLDLSFNPGAVKRTNARSPRRLAADGDTVTSGTVMSIDVQADARIIVGGLFDALQSVARHNVLRVLIDGMLDTSFDPGAGPNAAVNVLALQPDGRTLLGGAFSNVGGQSRAGAARLLGDNDAGPAVISIAAQVSQVVATPGTKTKVRVTRAGGDQTSALTINYKAVGTAQAGVDYKALKGSVVIPAGQATVLVKVKFLDAGPNVAAKRKLKLKLAAGDGYTLTPGGAKAQVVLLPP